MKAYSKYFRPAGVALILAVLAPTLLWGRGSVDPGQVAISVARWLEQGHCTRQKLDAEMSAKFL